MIKTFSSRAGRLSSTNKNYLSLQSNCLISPETKPKTNYPIVIDIGFGDAQSFSEDVLINKKYCFIGIEPIKKALPEQLNFMKRKTKNLFLYNGDAREFLEIIDYKFRSSEFIFPIHGLKRNILKED